MWRQYVYCHARYMLDYPNKGAEADTELIWYNTPELFLEDV